MCLAPACTFWLFLGILVLEWPAMLQEGAIKLMAQNPAKFCAAAVMGFGVNALAYVVIQLWSSLKLKVMLQSNFMLGQVVGQKWLCLCYDWLLFEPFLLGFAALELLTTASLVLHQDLLPLCRSWQR